MRTFASAVSENDAIFFWAPAPKVSTCWEFAMSLLLGERVHLGQLFGGKRVGEAGRGGRVHLDDGGLGHLARRLPGSSVSVGAGMFVRSVSSLFIAYPFTGTVRMNRKLRGGLASLALKSVRG